MFRNCFSVACARFVMLLTGGLLIVAAAPVHASWEITDLGTLPGGTFSAGSAINDSGQVAGSGDLTPIFNDLGERVDRPFAFISGPHGGSLTVIDSGPADAFLTNFDVKAMNNNGEVAGSALQGSSFPFAYATDANGVNLHFIGNDQFAASYAHSIDINNLGTVLYQSLVGGISTIEPDGAITEITSNEEAGEPIAINDSGQVVLNFAPPDPQTPGNGYLWSASTGIQSILSNGSFSNAFDINNSGQILGQLQEPHGAVFITGTNGITFNLVDLPGGTFLDPTAGSPKFNDSAQIIGMLRRADGNSFAFVTGTNGEGFINLETLPDITRAGWSNLMVAGINNLGQIAGTGTINGNTRAFFLSPVPEPETWAIMLAGLGLLGGVARRRKAKVHAAA